MKLKKESLKGTGNTLQAFWVAMGSLSSMALGILSAMILSRYFNKTDYGTYKQILYVYSTLLFVFTAGLPRVFSYFLPRYSLEEGKTIVKKINRFLFLAGLIFSVFLYVFSGLISQILKNPDLSFGLKVFSPIPLLLLPTLGIEGIFSTYKKTIYIAIYNTLSRIIMLFFIVLPVVIFKGNYITAIYGWVAGSLLTFVMAYYFKGIPFKKIDSHQTSLNYKDIFAYSLPLVFASFWGIAIRSADQFYISRFFGADVFAEFSNGFIELPFVTMVTASASVVLMPMFSKAFHKNQGVEELILVWRNTLEKSSKIIYPLLIFFIFFASEIMVLMYSQKYEQSGVYFKINMFLNFFNIVIFTPLFLAMGKTKLYANVHMIMAFIVWGSSYLLIQIFNSPLAIAYNSTFWSIMKIITFLYLASKLMKISITQFFPIKTCLLIIVQSIIVVGIAKAAENYLVFSLPLFFQVAICGLIYGLLILVSGKFFKIDYWSVVQPLFKLIKIKR